MLNIRHLLYTLSVAVRHVYVNKKKKLKPVWASEKYSKFRLQFREMNQHKFANML